MSTASIGGVLGQREEVSSLFSNAFRADEPSPSDPRLSRISRALQAIDQGLTRAERASIRKHLQQKRESPKRARTDHLGMPVSTNGRARVKYARSITIVYERETVQQANQQHQLRREVKKMYDISLKALEQLLKLFQNSVRAGQSLVGPRTFKAVLLRHGIRDVVLQDRLFDASAEAGSEPKVDYRCFLRDFCVLDDAPIEQKLSLLFDVFDLDRSGSISIAELKQITASARPGGLQSALSGSLDEAVEVVWGKIQACRMSELQNSEYWMAPSRSAGLQREDLLLAVQQSTAVRDFFKKTLVAPPKLPDSATDGTVNFQARLKEMQAEISATPPIKHPYTHSKSTEQRAPSSVTSTVSDARDGVPSRRRALLDSLSEKELYSVSLRSSVASTNGHLPGAGGRQDRLPSLGRHPDIKRASDARGVYGQSQRSSIFGSQSLPVLLESSTSPKKSAIKSASRRPYKRQFRTDL